MNEGLFSIEKRQYSILGLAAHNYLVLRDQGGAVVSELHGLAYDPNSSPCDPNKGAVPIGYLPTHKIKVYEFRAGQLDA
ncbi:MAG: hypothetical protein ABW185_25385, partial [Sedimenticola sp.]